MRARDGLRDDEAEAEGAVEGRLPPGDAGVGGGRGEAWRSAVASPLLLPEEEDDLVELLEEMPTAVARLLLAWRSVSLVGTIRSLAALLIG